jgi:mannose-6-phosphate isomerase-like protein (cupin superfamily)
MPRKRMLFTFKEAADRGPFDEYPVLPEETDPQLHLSRNDRIQPFYVVCGKDTVIASMAGTGRVEFRDASVNYFETETGDFVYIPAGTIHRLHPEGENVTYRYRARQPGAEAVLWFCEKCNAELFRYDYDGDATLVQTAYAEACDAFNASPATRTCKACGHEHAAIDVSPYHWREIAEEVAGEPAAVPAAR